MQRREVWLMLRLLMKREIVLDEVKCDVSERCEQCE